MINIFRVLILAASLLSFGCEVKVSDKRYEKTSYIGATRNQIDKMDAVNALPMSLSIESVVHFQFFANPKDMYRQKSSFSDLLREQDVRYVSVGCDAVSVCAPAILEVLKDAPRIVDKVILFPERFPEELRQRIQASAEKSIMYGPSY